MDFDSLFKFSDLPPAWRFCFCSGCPRHGECLRYRTGLHVPDSMTCGAAVFPSAYRNGECRHFKQIRVIRAAFGFSALFSEVKQKDYTPLRDRMKAYLGGHGTYYRYNRGERMLTPEQQQWILDLFAGYGYAGPLAFDHYEEVVDFS